MQAFEFANPTTVAEAVKALTEAQGSAVALAGGTDLLSLMKDGVETPRRVVNLKSIKELQGIAYDPKKGLRLGALVTLDELMQNDRVKQEYPSLVQAADGVRSPQIQSVGTVGGDLCQRPRCWYYRSGYGLLAMKDGKSMVTDGDNRYHAILGTNEQAYYVNPSSLAPALIALNAKARIVGPRGSREIAVAELFRVPASEDEKELTLASGEIITEVLTPPAAQVRNATYEVRHREALDWPLAAAAAALEMDGNTVKSARIVLGHVAPVPWVATVAGQTLAGKRVTENLAEEAGEVAVRDAKPLSRNAYKVRLARVAVKRAILRAAGMEV
ncbi:MAG TPA: FAD binding domain-containing protein [Acidobacteriota bacterium]|nr:FAD binding domain-containing protein [Acidobacteriota bacterium]